MTLEYQTLSNFLVSIFPDLNPNSYDIKNMKFDLDASTKDLDLDAYIRALV